MDLHNSSRISDFDNINEHEICFHYDPSFMAAVKDTQERAKKRGDTPIVMIIREQIQANPTKLRGRGFVSSHCPAT